MSAGTNANCESRARHVYLHEKAMNFRPVSSCRSAILYMSLLIGLLLIGLLKDGIEDISHPEFVTIKEYTDVSVYLFPNEPFYQARTIVQESIGPEVWKDATISPLRNCSVTIQFRLILSHSRTPSTVWILQSMTSPSGVSFTNDSDTELPEPVPKTYGGDEIYVVWHSTLDPSNDIGVAIVSDLDDGTYALQFIRPPILEYNYSSSNNISNDEKGRLTIYYDYSCGIGGMFAPKKDNFTLAGEIHTSFALNDIPRPHINDFKPPNMDQAIDLSQYHTVISFGDSLMLQLSREYVRGRYWRPNIFYNKNVMQCLSDPDSDVDELIRKFREWHGNQVTEAANRSESVAVIAGSAVWDALRGCARPGFVDHVASVRSFVRRIRKIYPNMDLYWKSPSTVALHRRSSLSDLLDNPVQLQRSRYMSDAILRDLYHLQKGLMEELDVPFLDLYDAYYLSVPWTIQGSAVHYDDIISSLLLSYFWPGFDLGESFQRDN